MEGRALLRVTIVPRLFALSQTYHSRVWTKKTIPEVLRDVFQGGGLGPSDVEMRLSAQHPAEEHVTQYHESDYAFASRWMEREGITFFFDHTDEVDRLVLADHDAVYEGCQPGPVRYHPVSGGDVTAAQAFNVFRDRATAQPATITLVDYDYAKPRLAIEGREDVSAVGSEEVVEHGRRFFTPSDATRLAKLRAEERLAEERVYAAAGPLVGARPGYTFELHDHPSPELDRRYLVTTARHEGSQSTTGGEMERLVGRPLRDGYRVEITAVAADVQFRRRGTAPWPSIQGYEHGTIDGPAESPDGRASTRLRMMQPHGGNPEAFHFPLRKGTEVIIAFLGGDPDRPFIAGFVPDAARPSPVVARNHTQNVIQSGGLTRIEIEDRKGSQYVWIKTPPAGTYLFLGKPHKPATHNAEINTGADCLFDIGGKQDILVGGKLTETVTGAVTETYATSQTSTVTGPQVTTVTNAVQEQYGSTQSTTVHGLRKETFEAGHLTMVGGLREETYESGHHTTVTGAVTELYTGGLTRTVTGATTEHTTGALDMLATGAVTQTYPAGVTQVYGPLTATWASMTWTAGPVTIDAPHWHVSTPSHVKLFGGWDKCNVLVTATADLSIEVTGIALEATGAERSVRGVSSEETSVKVTMDGPRVKNSGVENKVKPVHVKISGIHIHT
jgi:type VI secretion system secreted protein VgrG